MTIATRAAAARPEETWFQVRVLAREVWGPAANWPTPFEKLCDLNTPESLLAAAMMLDASGFDLRRAWDGSGFVTLYSKGISPESIAVYAATPALALIAAIAASRGV